MKYIVFDLELNQDFASIRPSDKWKTRRPFEIIQIGAVMLNNELDTFRTFDRLVKPTFYTNMNPFVSELTGITIEQLQTQNVFPEVYREFIAFISGTDLDGKLPGDTILCTWGKSDVVELFRNVLYHDQDEKLLPNKYINLQTAVSICLGFSQNRSVKLQSAVEAFEIKEDYSYHNALHDAFYTAELLKKLSPSELKIELYSPFHVPDRPKFVKKVIAYDKLVQQFEKMYARELSTEEQEMITLAYKMGRTQQFTK